MRLFTVAVPENTPVDVLKVIPEGRFEETIEYVTEDEPSASVAAIDCEND